MLLPEVFLYAYAAQDWARLRERRARDQQVSGAQPSTPTVGDWRPDDWHGLLALHRAVGASPDRHGIAPLGEDRLAAWVDEMLRRGPNVVARVGQRVVGHAVLRAGATSLEPMVFVHREYDGTGLESALVAGLLTAARRRRIPAAAPRPTRARQRPWITVGAAARRVVRAWALAKARATSAAS